MKTKDETFDVWTSSVLFLQGKPVFLIGEGMGGVICMGAVRRHPERYAGVVLLGPVSLLVRFPVKDVFLCTLFFCDSSRGFALRRRERQYLLGMLV